MTRARGYLESEGGYIIDTKSYVLALKESGALKIAQDANHLFELRNGSHSWLYVDHGLLLPENRYLSALIENMSAQLSHPNYSPSRTVLANVDSKSSPQLTGILAYTLGYREIAVNSEETTRREHGTNLRLRMPPIHEGDTILVVDDVLTHGDTTILDVIKLIKAELGEERSNQVYFGALVGLCRDQHEHWLTSQGIRVSYLHSAKLILQYFWRLLDLTDEQKTALGEEFDIKDYEWREPF